MAKTKEKLADVLYEFTHLVNEDGEDVPFFCFVSDIINKLELDFLTEEEIADAAIKFGYKVFKAFATEEARGGLLACAEGCEKAAIEHMYEEFYGEVPEIEAWGVDEEITEKLLTEDPQYDEEELEVTDDEVELDVRTSVIYKGESEKQWREEYPLDDREQLLKAQIKPGIRNILNYIFSRFSSITSIVIPDSVTRLGDYSFYSCKSLNAVKLPSSLKTIGKGAFRNCTSLKKIVIPPSVSDIDNEAFSDTSITEVKIPHSVNSLGNYVFSGCSKLTKVTMPYRLFRNVHGGASLLFSGCDSLKTINIEQAPIQESFDVSLNEGLTTKLVFIKGGNHGSDVLTEEQIKSMIIEAGHLSKGLSAEDIAKKHDIDVKEIKAQVDMGIKVEKEHTSDDKAAERIALDHLFEIPDYYTRLTKMEKTAKLGEDVDGDKWDKYRDTPEDRDISYDYEVITGHSLEEYMELYGDKYNRGELHDYSHNDLAWTIDKTNEPLEPRKVMWLIKDRYFDIPKELDEKKRKAKKKISVSDPNAKAMWGRTRHKVEKPKKGKGSFSRKKKRTEGLEEKLVSPSDDLINEFKELIHLLNYTVVSVRKDQSVLADLVSVHVQIKSNENTYSHAFMQEVERLAKALDEFDDEKDCALTYNIGVVETGHITAGIDIREQWVPDEEEKEEEKVDLVDLETGERVSDSEPEEEPQRIKISDESIDNLDNLVYNTSNEVKPMRKEKEKKELKEEETRVANLEKFVDKAMVDYADVMKKLGE